MCSLPGEGTWNNIELLPYHVISMEPIVEMIISVPFPFNGGISYTPSKIIHIILIERLCDRSCTSISTLRERDDID